MLQLDQVCGLAHVMQQLAREITVRVPLLPLKTDDVLVLACATGCIVLQDGACCLGAQRHCRTHLGIQVSSDEFRPPYRAHRTLPALPPDDHGATACKQCTGHKPGAVHYVLPLPDNSTDSHHTLQLEAIQPIACSAVELWLHVMVWLSCIWGLSQCPVPTQFANLASQQLPAPAQLQCSHHCAR
jgi:hypothetical protein